MCPPIPGLALLDISINSSWSDEELVRFLAERKVGDSLPGNILEGMNLSLIDPRKSHGNTWYMNCSSDDHQPYESGENAIRYSEYGYWKPINAVRIPTSTGIAGFKTSLEFYEGQPPSGKRTGLLMHEYQVEQNVEANAPKDYNSLYTIFLQNDRKLNAGDQQISLNANACNDHMDSYIDYLAEIEKQQTATNTEMVASNQQNFSSSTGQDEHKTRSAAEAIAFHHAVANEDYIEMNDLLISSEASSSTSENSSKRSMISEEYFDSDAFLREVLKDHNEIDEEPRDPKFSITLPTRSDHVVITPPEQVLVYIHDSNATVSGASIEKSVPDGERGQHSNECLQDNPSTSSCFPISRVKRSHSNSSTSSQDSTKSPQRAQGSTKSPQRDPSTSKFGKFGKKYFCFGSF